MKKPHFSSEFDDFYTQCLAELKRRSNYTDAFLPILERYVTITAKLSKLNVEIVDHEIIVDHTNKAGATNQVSSPHWRMFLSLNKEAIQLAKELELSPSTAPITANDNKKKGFDLGNKLKIA